MVFGIRKEGRQYAGDVVSDIILYCRWRSGLSAGLGLRVSSLRDSPSSRRGKAVSSEKI
jgi:hypothetical protein